MNYPEARIATTLDIEANELCGKHIGDIIRFDVNRDGERPLIDQRVTGRLATIRSSDHGITVDLVAQAGGASYAYLLDHDQTVTLCNLTDMPF